MRINILEKIHIWYSTRVERLENYLPLKETLRAKGDLFCVLVIERRPLLLIAVFSHPNVNKSVEEVLFYDINLFAT